MSRSVHAEQDVSSFYNHHLHQFLTFLNRERGFADATIVNRGRSLKPFLEWLVAQNVSLFTVPPVVITKYFTSSVAGRWKRTTIWFHVQSLRSFFRYASSRGWCAAGGYITVRFALSPEQMIHTLWLTVAEIDPLLTGKFNL